MHAEKHKAEKKKRTKKQVVLQIISIVLIIAAGIGAGAYCGMLYLSSKIPKVNYNAFAEDELLPNISEILERNQGVPISQVSAVDAFVIAKYNTENSDMYIATAQNTLTHNFGKQSVYTYRHKYNGSILIKEISSSSMKSYAKMLKCDGAKVLAYNGTAKTESTAEWANNYSSYTIDEYKEEFGTNPLEIVSYIVSVKTLSETYTPKSGVKLANGNYQFTLSLNTQNSVINYVKQIKANSGIASYPTFLQLDIVFEVDQNFRLASLTSIESYTFSYSGIAVTCSGQLTTNFDYTTTPTEV